MSLCSSSSLVGRLVYGDKQGQKVSSEHTYTQSAQALFSKSLLIKSFLNCEQSLHPFMFSICVAPTASIKISGCIYIRSWHLCNAKVSRFCLCGSKVVKVESILRC